ncbi:phosphoenolpyruvate synthase [Daejeonella sp.]|jgi:pyruvate,water dikinase|uniref:phosphoenolpyruvate synthase n=1 Tax=Daejeonella sp. TaxID=2805397 RepID=UPI003783AA51
MQTPQYTIPFSNIRIDDIPRVGGKNSSIGEMFNELNPKGINIPDGFALSADAYRLFRKENGIEQSIKDLLLSLDRQDFGNLTSIGEQARKLILNSVIPDVVAQQIKQAYSQLCSNLGVEVLDVAVRSSATAEDLPTASFAGRMESYLNINGEEQLLEAIKLCYVSLFTDRAIKYRHDMGFMEKDIAISVGVQQMVRSDKASSGVVFTIDPDTGFKNTIIINGIWGLGENIVQGRAIPDEWVVFKPTLNQDQYKPILKSVCGKKEFTMVYAEKSELKTTENTILNLETPEARQKEFCLNNSEVIQLAKWCLAIEDHYGKAMDIEWAKDGFNNKLYIVQARPETVHAKPKKQVHEIYWLAEKSKLLATGIALGDKIRSGRARILNNPNEGKQLKDGEILVTDITNPDWDPILKKAAAIITNKGGRTSHAAIVARELGTLAIVGSGNATKVIQTGDEITVSCADGKSGSIYEGLLKWTVEEQDFSKVKLPKTPALLILSDPDRAFELSLYPNNGVGLMRLEFTISNSIKIHPLAFCEPEKVTDEEHKREIKNVIGIYEDGKDYFVNQLAEAVSTVAAAFYPKEVIVRFSDFKSNEYVNLMGGSYFEPREENPMIGLRGASRYYSDFYKEAFALECRAMKKVRDEMGLKNIKLMIPFCRTIEEGEKVLAEMAKNGLKKGENGLKVYVMIEIPSNVLMANEFAQLFDGFSIGSNDLTQLTLGIDRDSSLVSHLFNEENAAVKELIRRTIKAAKQSGIKVGLCGQAPSDIPEFAKFLIDEGIDSISFTPDALLEGIENMNHAEKKHLSPSKEYSIKN